MRGAVNLWQHRRLMSKAASAPHRRALPHLLAPRPSTILCAVSSNIVNSLAIVLDSVPAFDVDLRGKEICHVCGYKCIVIICRVPASRRAGAAGMAREYAPAAGANNRHGCRHFGA